jgi:hypothetical protein
MPEVTNGPENEADEDRRKFLASCGRFAVVTPPAITMLLSTSLTSDAIAHSGGARGGGRSNGNSNNNGNNGNHYGHYKAEPGRPAS